MRRLRRPIVAALFCHLAGLLVALRFTPLAPLHPPTILVGLLTTIALIVGFGDAFWRALPFLLFVLAGGLSGSAEVADFASDCRLALEAGRLREIDATLLASHRPITEHGALLPATLRIPGRPCDKPIRVRLPSEADAVEAGETVQLAGQWISFDRQAAAGPWPAEPGSGGFFRADTAVSAEGRVPGGIALRRHLDRTIAELFPRHQAAIEALLLGRREYLDRSLRDRFAAAGLAHLLAISGMHVGLLATFLLLVGSMLRVPRECRDWLALAGIWGYLAVIGVPGVGAAIRADVERRPAGPSDPATGGSGGRHRRCCPGAPRL